MEPGQRGKGTLCLRGASPCRHLRGEKIPGDDRGGEVVGDRGGELGFERF